jgi:hypothetical protein
MVEKTLLLGMIQNSYTITIHLISIINTYIVSEPPFGNKTLVQQKPDFSTGWLDFCRFQNFSRLCCLRVLQFLKNLRKSKCYHLILL